MIGIVSIRRGRAGTLETLKLIYGMGKDGAAVPYVDYFIRMIPIENWNSILGQYWKFQEEEEETLRSVRVQVANFYNYNRMIGDCDDAAVVATALAWAARMPFRIVAVRPPENPEFAHVFVEAQNARGWFRLDPTAPRNADYSQWERMEYPR